MATISQSEFERQIVSLGLVSSRKGAEQVSKHIRKALAGRRNDSDFAALLPGVRQLSAVGGNDQAARHILVKAQLWLGPDEGQTNHLGYRFHTKLAATLGVDTHRKSAMASAVAAVAVAGLRLHLSVLGAHIGQFGEMVADLTDGPVVDPAAFVKGAPIPQHLLRGGLPMAKSLGGDGAVFLMGGDCGSAGVI